MAQGDTSGSRAAAQVLLSTYNGNNFHMNLTDLCVLDLKYVEQALIVLRGRVMLCIEPQQMIEDGKSKNFRAWKAVGTPLRQEPSQQLI